MARGGISIALIIATVAALLFADLAAKAAQDFARHIPTRVENSETAARSWGGRAKAGGSYLKHKSYLVLLQGSGGSV